MRTILALLLILSLAMVADTTVAAESAEVEGMQSLDGTRYHRLDSQTLDKTYHIFVGLPDGYDSGSEQDYPTMYILDGGELYPLIRAYYNYLNFAEESPDLILVAISYGTDDFEQGNDRSHDYTAPSSEREFWGGAEDFQQFLSDELIPMIETSYRSDGDRRIVFGQSLGGQFVLYTAQTRPELFWGHIASNPALHRNLPFFLELHGEARNGNTDSRLFVGSASNDDPRFRYPAMRWIEHWSAARDKPWDFEAVTLEGHSHMSAPPAAFRRGIMWLSESR